MNIILLSGGSGKRLWPLSNDVRSKQFIKMLRNEAGEYESMMQRVYRQIMAVDPHADVTIATSKSQVGAIQQQMGDKVSICVEPERRDTFPAIALSAAFLHDEKGVGADETVVVCPVDPYVNLAYFQALKALDALAAAGKGKLNLLGMAPTYPADGFGYIIPESSGVVSRVKCFVEKPSAEAAARYIAQGALWNGGVFAFKLGYLLNIAHQQIAFADYRDLLAKYPQQTKISFDYAVVEKETDIQVLRFNDMWKDLGAWDTFTEAMEEPVIGKATVDATCDNVKIINETDLPILCMGLKDTIVAASVDGILVTSRAECRNIKPYVDNMHERVKYAEKSWGSFTILDVRPSSLTIKIVLQAGNRLNYHSHARRNEVWTVMSGRGHVIVEGVAQPIAPGDVVKLPVGCKHTVVARTELEILEVQLGSDISIEDKRKYDFPAQ